MYTDILGKIRTREEARRLEEEVDIILEALYKTGEDDFTKALDKEVRSWVGASIKEELGHVSISKKDYLDGLKKKLTNLSVVKLTLAHEPTENGLSKIQSWIQSNLGEGIVSDINYNPRLLAGAVVIFKGKYVDLSFKKRFNTIFISKKTEIFNQLNKSEARNEGR